MCIKEKVYKKPVNLLSSATSPAAKPTKLTKNIRVLQTINMVEIYCLCGAQSVS